MIGDFANKPNREIADNIPGFVYHYWFMYPISLADCQFFLPCQTYNVLHSQQLTSTISFLNNVVNKGCGRTGA